MLYNIFSQIMINRKQNKEVFLKKKKKKKIKTKQRSKQTSHYNTLLCFILLAQTSTSHKSPQKVVSLVLFVLPHRLLFFRDLKRLSM